MTLTVRRNSELGKVIIETDTETVGFVKNMIALVALAAFFLAVFNWAGEMTGSPVGAGAANVNEVPR
jgi:hypothetical protein